MSKTLVQQLLASFSKIGLGEMDNVKLMNRVDTKFVLTTDQFYEVLPKLSEHYDVVEINGKSILSYESLYYDNEELDFYHDHHKKRLNRVKIRYRKYLDSDISFLEIKHKYKGRTNKMRIPSEDLFDELPEEHVKFIDDSVDLSFTQDLIPTLVNNYRRITLVGKELNERLTIDIDLSFKKGEQTESLDHIAIAELKQVKVSRKSPFFALMKERQIRPLRLSKYCIGLLQFSNTEDVKYNRFKKKLLKIDKLKGNVANCC
ncbi:MAG: polyphosphate polymerase domain-containing protein [Flavobacteriales bacterium]|nr:polyphosphate polymerase domain-containing protein [Flavobacteriales bacterium]